jgi:hypothetical protein
VALGADRRWQSLALEQYRPSVHVVELIERRAPALLGLPALFCESSRRNSRVATLPRMSAQPRRFLHAGSCTLMRSMPCWATIGSIPEPLAVAGV